MSLYIFQDKLIFSPKNISQERLEHIKKLGSKVEEINKSMKDGNRLSGWFVKNSEERRKKNTDLLWRECRRIILYGRSCKQFSRLVVIFDKL